jgi:hypothetical protein
VFAILLTASVAVSGVANEASEFRAAFALRRPSAVQSAPDLAIVKCMDLIVRTARKEATSEDAAARLAQRFSSYLPKDDGASTDWSSIGIATAKFGGRIAIGVCMGPVSRLRLFNGLGKEILLPSALRWNPSFNSIPRFLPGGLLAVDSSEILDAGMRYDYRVRIFKPNSKGYQQVQSMAGRWLLSDPEDEHFTVDGLTATFRTLEAPKAFTTAAATRLFVCETIVDYSHAPYEVEMRCKDRAALRAVDAWMANAMRNPSNDLEKEFFESYGTEPQQATDVSERVISEDQFEVTLQFDKKYVFVVESKGGVDTILSLKTE